MEKRLQPRTEAPAAGGTAHLRDYWRIIRRGRYTVLTIFVIVVGLTLLRVTFSTPIYKATAMIEVKPEARRILPGQEQWVGAEGGGWIAEEKYFNTQLEVLKSREVAARTFARLHLDNHPRFKKHPDPIGLFASLIEVRPKTETRLVAVSLTGTDPKEVREWVNTLSDVYVRRNVENAVESFNAIMDEISRGLESFRAKLEQADTQRLQIAADEELFVPENQQEILRSRLAAYNDQLSAARVEITSLEAELAGLARVRREGGDFMSIPRCAQDPVVQELHAQQLDAERELQRLATEKKPKHPEYLAKEIELEKIRAALDEQAGRVITKLESQSRLKKAEAVSLQAHIRETEHAAYRVQQASAGYDLSKNEAEAKRKVYDVVAETMERLTVAAQLVSMNNNVSILDKAIEPRRPVKPRKLMSLAFGGFFGLLLGLGAVLFMDYLDNTVRSPEDIEQYLGLGILAIVPKRRETASHAVREAFQSLRTSILFSSHNRERRILLVSSAGPQEGKSSTVAALARTFASAGDRVVVIDCDLRRPTQHVHMNLSREPGLTNYLLDGSSEDLDRFLHPTDIETLKVLTCGPVPPNPPELIGSTKFRDLLHECKRRFDWVVVDSPPVVNLADTIVLASMAELVALVIKHNENDRDLIRRSVKQLADVNANIIGAVLNNVDLDRAHYGDYYYAGYYYYGDGGESKRGSKLPTKKKRESGAAADRVAL